MSAFVVVNITVEDAATYEEYRRMVPPSIAHFGGRYLARGGATTVLEGDWQPARLVIVEFPSADQTRAGWASPEYAAAKALRQRCSRADLVVVEGMPSPAA